jgi:NAD(P)-dependent dehydrogenase (short-subunit alcohol dehydrogenase family)
VVVTAVNPGMAWTSMTQSLSPEIVPVDHIMPIVRFFQRRADPERAARHCERLVLAGRGRMRWKSPANPHPLSEPQGTRGNRLVLVRGDGRPARWPGQAEPS